MIKLFKTWKNKTNDGEEYKTHSFCIEEDYGKMYFSVRELPNKNGGTYLKLPETIYDKELFLSSDYKKGITRHIIPNGKLIETLWELIKESNEKNEPKTFEAEINTEDINIDDIDF